MFITQAFPIFEHALPPIPFELSRKARHRITSFCLLLPLLSLPPRLDIGLHMPKQPISEFVRAHASGFKEDDHVPLDQGSNV